MSFSSQHPYLPTTSADWPTTPATGQDADDYLAARTKALEAGAGTGGFTFVRKLSDETVTSSAALQDDDELFFAVGANEIWEFDLRMLTSGGSAGDVQWAFSVPAGATGAWGHAAAAAASTGATDANFTALQGYGDANALQAGLNNTLSVILANYSSGYIVTAATAGTVRLRWAQLVSNATGTIVRAGSVLKATRVSPIQPAGANYGAMQLVSRQVLAAAATSIDFSGLDLNADEMYLGVYSIKNATAVAQDLSLQYNGDTTATNYRRQYIAGQSSTAAAGNTNNAVFIGVDVAANGATSGYFLIHKPISGQRVRAANYQNHGPFSASAQIAINSHQWTTTGSNVASFKLVHPTASGIDTGSYVSLYRLAPVPMASDGFREVIAVSDSDVASNTVVATDAELFFTMEAGAMYEWEAVIKYSSPVGGTTPDMKFNFNGPATLTGEQQITYYVNNTDGLVNAPSSAALTASAVIGTATTPRLARSSGWAYSTAGGVGNAGFQFQWAQNTSNANATRRHLGSKLRWKKIGS